MIIRSAAPDLKRNDRGEPQISWSLHIWQLQVIQPNPCAYSLFSVFIRVLMGYRGLLVSAECQHPPGRYRIYPIAMGEGERSSCVIPLPPTLDYVAPNKWMQLSQTIKASRLFPLPNQSNSQAHCIAKTASNLWA